MNAVARRSPFSGRRTPTRPSSPVLQLSHGLRGLFGVPQEVAPVERVDAEPGLPEGVVHGADLEAELVHVEAPLGELLDLGLEAGRPLCEAGDRREEEARRLDALRRPELLVAVGAERLRPGRSIASAGNSIRWLLWQVAHSGQRSARMPSCGGCRRRGSRWPRGSSGRPARRRPSGLEGRVVPVTAVAGRGAGVVLLQEGDAVDAPLVLVELVRGERLAVRRRVAFM